MMIRTVSNFFGDYLKLFAFFLLISFTIFTLSCEKEIEQEGISPEPEGVFSDVIKALDEVGDEYPQEISEEDGIGKKEKRLLLEGRSSFYVPIDTYDYYYDYDSEEGQGADPLETILDSEWEEYMALSKSISLEDTSSTNAEVREKIEENLEDFYIDLPKLMADINPLPKSIREKVIHIVSLRYHNIILRGGLDPVSFFEGSK
jgi:hypothetical protein